jgi:hypothetical protein
MEYVIAILLGLIYYGISQILDLLKWQKRHQEFQIAAHKELIEELNHFKVKFMEHSTKDENSIHRAYLP